MKRFEFERKFFSIPLDAVNQCECRIHVKTIANIEAYNLAFFLELKFFGSLETNAKLVIVFFFEQKSKHNKSLKKTSLLFLSIKIVYIKH